VGRTSVAAELDVEAEKAPDMIYEVLQGVIILVAFLPKTDINIAAEIGDLGDTLC